MNEDLCESGSMCVEKLSWGVLFVILLLLPALLLGQGYFGSVSGEITDQSGAVVPGAKVTLVDQQKGYTFATTTENNGRYLFVSVPPGSYTVSAEAPGFEKVMRTGLALHVSENAAVNLGLNLATSKQTVEVQAQAQSLKTEDAVTGQVVNRRFINDLPLVDRYVLDFVELGPGMNNQSDTNSVGDTGTNYISNGSRGANSDILMDGVSITNFDSNGGILDATYTPSVDAVEEFKVQQTNFSAEYGFTGATVVNMVTRSGSNAFHGSAYDFIRNQMTDANNWFNNAGNTPIPPVHRHNYGGTIGGPIIKNRTFFFFDWDGTRSSSMSTYMAGVPSAAERTGDFGEVCAANGGTFDSTGLCSTVAGQLYDPYSGTFQTPANGPAGAYRSAFIPYNNLAVYASPGNPNLAGTPYQLTPAAGNLIDPVAQKLMNLFPAANIPGGNIYDNWIASGASPSASDQFDIKIDHRFSEKNLLSAKYSDNWNNYTAYSCFKNFADPCGGGINGGGAHLFSLNDTYTFSPTLLLTSTFGFSRGSTLIDAYNKKLNADPLGTLGFPSYLDSNGFLGVPAIWIGPGYYSAGYTTIGQDPYGNYRQGQDTGQLTEVLTKIQGKHELKFGFEGRLHQQNYIQTNAPVGNFNFGSLGSSQCPDPEIAVCGGDGMASFMMGQLMGGSAGYEIQFRVASQNYQYAGFTQDNWKATSKLTLNMGLRYDVSLPRTERHNRMNWLDPSVVSPLSVPGMGTLYGGEMFDNARVRTDWDTDFRDFQPRFGFAYQLASKTVVRGGYGIYFSQTRSGANGLLSYGSQGFNQSTSAVTTYQNDGATPWLHLSNPFPDGLIQPPGSSLGLLNDVGYGAVGPLRTPAAARTPYEQSWSFGIEHQLASSMLLEVQYIGKKGTRLYFGGDNNLDILGSQVESMTPTEIGNLGNYVNNPFASVLTGSYYANSVLSSPTVQAYQLMLPYPQFTGMAMDEPPSATSIYNALQIMLEKHYSNGLQLSANYTWSKSIDDSSIADTNVAWLSNYGQNSVNYGLADPNRLNLERSLSTFDMPQQLKFNYTYDLPFGRGKAFLSNMSRPLELILGGWKTAGVWTIHDGFPLQFAVTGGGTPIWTYGWQRADISSRPVRSGGPESNWLNNYFANPNVFQAPAAYTLGTASRTTGEVRSPSTFTNNLSIMKDFALSHSHEAMKLELRLEAENAFNHPVFGTPDTYVGDPNFGVINYTAIGPRQIQLALKLEF
ncbi:MAG: carboxypeptidase regulatory-like domain-containing protein [Terriglobia bacterium]